MGYTKDLYHPGKKPGIEYYVSQGGVEGQQAESPSHSLLEASAPWLSAPWKRKLLWAGSKDLLLSIVVIVVMAPGSPWLQNPGWQGRQGQPPPQSESPQQSPPRGCPPTCKVSTHEFSTGLPCEISGPQHLPSLLQALPGGPGGTLGSWLQGRGGERSRCPARVRTVRAVWY